MCLNGDCAQGFWKIQSNGQATVRAMTAAEELGLKLDDGFLMRRMAQSEDYRSMFELRPALQDLWGLSGTGLAVANTRAIWQGLCCPQCGLCTAKVYWDKWHCPSCACQWRFSIGTLPVSTVVGRVTSSYLGNCAPNFTWPVEDMPYHGPEFRNGYRVDEWLLHKGAKVIVLTPTKEANAVRGGADELWAQILQDADAADLRLMRVPMRISRTQELQAAMSRFFVSSWGQKFCESRVQKVR